MRPESEPSHENREKNTKIAFTTAAKILDVRPGWVGNLCGSGDDKYRVVTATNEGRSKYLTLDALRKLYVANCIRKENGLRTKREIGQFMSNYQLTQEYFSGEEWEAVKGRAADLG